MGIDFGITQTFLYFLVLACVSLFYYVAMRKNLYGLFDPLVLLLINFVFSGTLVIMLGIFGYIRAIYLIAYVVCSLFFIAGFQFSQVRLDSIRSPRVQMQEMATQIRQENFLHRLDFNHLFVFVVILFVVNIVLLAYAFQTSALAIFSGNPAVDRVAIAISNRWLTVMSGAIQVPGLVFSTFVVLQSRRVSRNVVGWLAMASFVLSAVSGGSKGGILSLVFVFGLLEICLNMAGLRRTRTVRRLIYLFFLVGLMYLAYIASRLGFYGQNWFDVFWNRNVLSGEAYIYFFAGNQYESLKFTYNIFTYILHTFTAGLGIKLIPYNIGVALYGGATGNYSGFGPNPQHVVEGMVFWGIWGAPFYSLLIGYLTSYTRRLFFGRSGNLAFLAFVVLFYYASYLPIDITIWLFNVLSATLILLPIYVVSKVLAVWLYKPRYAVRFKANLA